LILTAPVERELQQIASERRQVHGIPVQIIAQDLTQPQAPKAIFTAATEQLGTVDILVNNAGLGQRAKFWDYPFERDQEMIRVNVEAVIALTKLFLPPMRERRKGRIMNTASIAGFEPGPLLAVYHATKAFVLSFTEALGVELEDSGITVTALCPGATDTDFFPKANMVQTKAFQKSKVMSPQEVAEVGYDAVMRGDRVFVPGTMNKALVFSRRFMSIPAQARVNKKFYEDAPPEKRKRHRGDIQSAAQRKFRRRRMNLATKGPRD
jgi:short-subunit dehydrogenase